MTSFERGFIKRAAGYGVTPDQAARLYKLANGFLESIYPPTSHSIFDVAENVTPSGDGAWDTVKEVGSLGGHMANHGLAPGVLGAAGGAGIGALLGGKDKKNEQGEVEQKGSRLRAAGKGALVGGALGFGSGVVHDAYNLGNNTKEDIRASLIRELQNLKQDKQHTDGQWWNPFKPSAADYNNAAAPYMNQINNLKDTSWYDYFMPWRVEQKLHK